MSRKLVLAMTLTILLTGMLGVVFRVQRVEASGTIYIKADGGVEPDTAPISSVDNVTYIFTGNIYDEIVIQRDNIVVDGAGFTVLGTGAFDSHGIDLNNRNNVTIKNAEIKEFQNGISLEHSNYSNMYQNNITNNKYGIVLFHSSSNRITGNKIANSHSDGIYLQYSSNNSITGNDVINNDEYGIVLDESSNNEFYHNNFIGNTQHVHVTFGYTNFWDDGFSSGGNYWSNYTDIDQYSGPYQNETESDGIWDTPYVIDENNQDNYPIVPEFPTWTSILLTLFVLTVAIAICKRRLLKTSIH